MSTNAGIAAEIAKGWKPNQYLTNMSQAYFAQPGDWVAPSIFPICPVATSSGFYYTFDKRQVEQMPKGSIHERLAWGARKSEMENQQRKKNKTKNRGMER